MSIPKEPRQQMINIMYLVLIALLALSVSSEILNAFKVVNRGIDKSNLSIREQIDAMLFAFEEKVNKEENADGKPYFDAAQNANKITSDFVAFVEGLENELKQESGIDEAGELKKPDDQDTPSRLMVDGQRGYELEEKIKAARAEYVKLFSAFKGDAKAYKSDTSYLNRALPLNAPLPPEDSEKKDWPTYTFYQMPVAGAVTLLNQIKNDAISSEAVIVQRFSEKVGGVKPKIVLDKFKAIAVPSSSKVEQGEPVSIKVFLSSPSEGNPVATIGGKTIPIGANGVAEFPTTASQLGSQTISGSLAVAGDKGKMKNLPFKTSYNVVEKVEKKPPVKDLSKELEAAKRRIKELEEKLKTMIPRPKQDPNLEIAKLKEELKLFKLKPEVKDLSKELAEARARIKFLEENWELKRPKVKDLSKELEAAKKEIARLKAELDKKKNWVPPKAEIKDLSKELAEALRKIEQQKKEIAQQKKRIDEQKKEIERLKRELEKKKDWVPPKKDPKKPDPTIPLKNKIKDLEEQLKKKPKVVTTTKEVDPQGVVSPDKMNVFYIGVDNPVSLSVSGASIDDVKATIDKGQLVPNGRGKYIVRVPGPHGSKANIALSVGGSVINRNLFRVKRVPDPVPEVGGKSGGTLGTGEMKAQRGVIARLKDFDFDARFEVLGFELTLAERGQDLLIVGNKGARFNDKSKNLLKKAKVGSIYYFDNIKVRGPDKTTRKLPSISFKIR